MRTLIIFLRAVNVTGKNLLPMALLQKELALLGYEQVKTYIQSGNILLKTSQDREEVKIAVEAMIKDKFSLAISSFVLEQEELKKAMENNPFDASLPGNRVFLTFISPQPTDEDLAQSKLVPIGAEEFHLIDKVVYFYLPDGMARSVLNNAFFEKKWNVQATGRNWNTIQKMNELIHANN